MNTYFRDTRGNGNNRKEEKEKTGRKENPIEIN